MIHLMTDNDLEQTNKQTNKKEQKQNKTNKQPWMK